MGAPLGNKYAVGKHQPGAGRKSAYFEKRDAYFLRSLFFRKIDKDKLKRKIASGNYSLKDMFVAKAFQGDTKILGNIFGKLFADYRDYNIDAVGISQPLKIQKPEDVIGLLTQTVNQVRGREIDEDTANRLAMLSGHLIRAFETTDMEQRLEKLEKAVEQRN